MIKGNDVKHWKGDSMCGCIESFLGKSGTH